MPYRVTDNVTGNIITFENPPSELDLKEAFGSATQTNKPITSSVRGDATDAQVSEWERRTANSMALYGSEDSPTMGQKIARKASPFVRPALELGGMTVGGLLAGGAGVVEGLATGPGAVVASPGLAATQGLAGAGLGYAAGKNVADYIDEYAGIKKPESLPKRIGTTTKDVAEGAAIQASGPIIGKAVTGVAKAVSGPFRKQISKESLDVTKLAKESGIDLTPADITQSGAQSQAENLLSRVPGAGTLIFKQRLNQLKQLTKLRNDIIQKGGNHETADQIGNRVLTEVDNFVKRAGIKQADQINSFKDKILKDIGFTTEATETIGQKTGKAAVDWTKGASAKAEELYSVAHSQAPKGRTVPVDNTQKYASDALKELAKAEPSLQDSKIVSILKDFAGQSEVEGMITPGSFAAQMLEKDPVTMKRFLEAQGVLHREWEGLLKSKQQINSMIADADKTFGSGAKLMSGSEIGVLKQLAKNIEADMNTYANSVGGEFKKSLDKANLVYRKISELKDKSSISKVIQLAEKSPEKVSSFITDSGDVTSIKTIRGMLKNKFQPVEQKFTSELIESSSTNGVLDGKKLLSQIDKHGAEKLTAIYGDSKKVQILKDLADGSLKIEKFPTANNFYMSLVKSLEKDPQKVVDLIIKPQSTKNIALAKAVLSPETWKGVQTKFLEGLLTTNKQYAGAGENLISPAKFTTKVFKYGDDTIKKVVGDDAFKSIKEVEKLSQYSGTAERIAGNPSGTGQAVISAAYYGGATVNLLADPTDPKRWAIVLGPAALAKLYLSPAGRKYLTMGYKVKTGSPASISLATKVLAIAGNDVERIPMDNAKQEGQDPFGLRGGE